LHCARGRHDADVFPIRADQADFRGPDAIIDARAGFALRRGIVGSAGYGGRPSHGGKRAQDSAEGGGLQPEKPPLWPSGRLKLRKSRV
jgi:hypothetical protein